MYVETLNHASCIIIAMRHDLTINNVLLCNVIGIHGFNVRTSMHMCLHMVPIHGEFNGLVESQQMGNGQGGCIEATRPSIPP